MRDVNRRGRPSVATPDVDLLLGNAIEALEGAERALRILGRPAHPVSRIRDGVSGLRARWRETGEVQPDVG